MNKDDRLYGKFTLDFADNPKILPLSDAAFRCLVEATLYSRRMKSDGFLATRLATAKWGVDVLAELCENDPEKPSLVKVDKGYSIRDYAEHQDTKAEIEARQLRNKLNGSLGGQARAKRLANQPAKRQVKPTHSTTQAETETEKQVKIPVRAALERDFDSFWEVYPRKEGKQAAKRKYMTLRRTLEAAPLLEGARAYALMSLGKEKQHVKMAQGWLNDGRWDDEVQTSIPLPPRSDVYVHTHKWMPDGTCLHCEERQGNPF
jgi:hypothetical protein